MKLIGKFFVLAFIASFFVSCGGGDNGPVSGQVSTTFSIQYGVVAAAGSTTTVSSTPNATVSLSDILTPSDNQDKAKYVKGSVISNASTISITGITGTGATLSNITFATDDGTIKNVVLNDSFNGKVLALSSDTILEATDTKYADLLKQAGNYLATKKSIALKATYTVGNQTITSGKISLNIATTFGW